LSRTGLYCPRCDNELKERVYTQERWDNVKQVWYRQKPSKIYCDKCGYNYWIPDNTGFPIS